MRHALLIAAAMLALPGCNKGTVDEKNASVEQVAKAIAGASSETRFTPGRWETSVTVTGIDAPNLPPHALAGAQAAMGKAHLVATCLSPEDAAHPEKNFFNRDVKTCRYDHFTMGGGKIDAALTCGGPAAGLASAPQSSVKMAGTYDPTHYNMTMATRAEQGPGGAMTINMAMTSHLAGACRGNEMKG